MIARLLVVTMACVVLGVGILPGAEGPDLAGRARVAEGEGDWERALEIYRSILASDDSKASVWRRVADIEARLDRPVEAAEALAEAAKEWERNPRAYAELSSAWAVADKPEKALDAIRKAASLDPLNLEYQRSLAEILVWVGEYEEAESIYRHLVERDAEDLDARLAWARMEAWSGELDEAVRRYREALPPEVAGHPGLLDWARAEYWRGSYSNALEVLDRFEREVGTTEESRRIRAAVLARGGRPRAALKTLEELRDGTGDELELELYYAIALSESHRARDAIEHIREVSESFGDRPEVVSTRQFVETPWRSFLRPMVSRYTDSDGMERISYDLEMLLAMASRFRLGLAYGDHRFEAVPGSGLEPPEGPSRVDYDQWRVSFGGRLGSAASGALHFGQSRSDVTADLDTYGGNLDLRLGDRAEARFTYERSLFALSPRTVARGLYEEGSRVQVRLTPSIGSSIDAVVGFAEISDGNERWEAVLAPRWVVVRREHLHLDLGLRGWSFGYDLPTGDGYYSPERFERYSVTLGAYFVLGQRHGIALNFAGGPERDRARDEWDLGGDLSVEATFGIYDDWMLRLRAAYAENRRTETGAFNADAFQVALTRRF